jgi:hypothetical protein
LQQEFSGSGNSPGKVLSGSSFIRRGTRRGEEQEDDDGG